MNTRTYVQGCGYHEMAYAPPEVVAQFLAARGFRVEVIPLDGASAATDRLRSALVRVTKGAQES
ncbi:MAG: hypothetical protein KIT09_19585 [Bryobacteraceae bacterium]|nr:hypothetical protein [Bryobacteraceae bacterium]